MRWTASATTTAKSAATHTMTPIAAATRITAAMWNTPGKPMTPATRAAAAATLIATATTVA